MGAVAGKKIEPLKCLLCTFSSKRITTVERHIQDVHGVSAKQAYDNANGGPTLCACGCGSETSWINAKVGYSRMICGHNAKIYAVYDEQTATKLAQTRGSNWRGKVGWSKGLTKETDERVKARAEKTSVGRKLAFSENRIEPWSKGLTKETDERVKSLADQLRASYESGQLIPWAKGLTKETDDRIAHMASKVSITHKTTHLRKRLDDIKRLTAEDVRTRIESTGTLRVISDLSSYVSDAVPNITVVCTTCDDKMTASLRKLKYHRCYTCDPSGSAAQGEVTAFIESLGFEVKKNDRETIKGDIRNAELDIYVPEKSFAIEFNGLYWHSAAFKSNAYHQNKTDVCREANINLMQVFSDEWSDKRDIIKSMIRHRLGMTTRKLNARACKVITLGAPQRKEFFNANHIDGDTQATFAIGLTINDELVGAISVRQPFHKKHESSLEIARLATLKDTNVRGAIARLSKAALTEANKRGVTRLITYVDTRLSSISNSWSSAGWTYVNETAPRFWWTDNKSRFNRFKYRADKSRNMTEAQVAEEAGVVRIYGCKNLTFELRSQ